MTADQLPAEIREFANYLDGLLARLDPSGGWCAVFWQRDPDGMRACLDGREMPPWDVVEALLRDLAGQYGPGGAGPETERARSLHAAALAAFDSRPGGRDALGDLLDVMLREQRFAAERQAGLARQLASAATREQADALRLDLAWARDDHERATVRCAELRARMAHLDRQGPGSLPTAPSEGHRAADSWRRADGNGPEAEAWARAGEPAGSARGYGTGPVVPVAREASDATAGEFGFPRGGGHGSARAGELDSPRGGEHGSPRAGDPREPAAHGRPHAFTDPGPGPEEASRPSTAPGRASAGQGRTPAGPGAGQAPVHGPHPASAASGQARTGQDAASGASGWTPPAPGVQAAQRAPLSPQGSTLQGPTPAPPGRPTPTPGQTPTPAEPAPAAPQPPAAPEPPAPQPPASKQRKRRRGGARFAGMVEEDAAPVVVPPAAVPASPVPAPAAGRTPRGARYAWAAEEAVAERPAPETGPVGAAERTEVTRTVETLARLRGEGRSGEAHALLVEAASWAPARLPLLAHELERAGLGADWQTLLWEAASLPAGRLVAAADALVAAGRAADGQQMLRQGVARPPGEVGEAVLGLVAEGRRREVRALLDAYVRARTPEEAARSAEPDPQRLVPLLLEAAQGVSDERRWDLLHALRVAGFAV
ncbi:hypothetical protein ACFY78_17595 [Streptomyces olindensis]|uniref:hypothetical protein n=1 Tax=Streptomyces olindensis TaxID=358823 RepID=UPI00368A8471